MRACAMPGAASTCRRAIPLLSLGAACDRYCFVRPMCQSGISAGYNAAAALGLILFVRSSPSCSIAAFRRRLADGPTSLTAMALLPVIVAVVVRCGPQTPGQAGDVRLRDAAFRRQYEPRRHVGARPGEALLGAATLANYRFVIARSRVAGVHGVLWRLTPRDRATLDAWENIAAGLYRAETLPGRGPAGRRRMALVYIAAPRRGAGRAAAIRRSSLRQRGGVGVADAYVASLSHGLRPLGAAQPQGICMDAIRCGHPRRVQASVFSADRADGARTRCRRLGAGRRRRLEALFAGLAEDVTRAPPRGAARRPRHANRSARRRRGTRAAPSRRTVLDTGNALSVGRGAEQPVRTRPQATVVLRHRHPAAEIGEAGDAVARVGNPARYDAGRMRQVGGATLIAKPCSVTQRWRRMPIFLAASPLRRTQTPMRSSRRSPCTSKGAASVRMMHSSIVATKRRTSGGRLRSSMT